MFGECCGWLAQFSCGLLGLVRGLCGQVTEGIGREALSCVFIMFFGCLAGVLVVVHLRLVCLLACLLTCVLYTLSFLPSPLLLLVLEHGLRLRPFLFIK